MLSLYSGLNGIPDSYTLPPPLNTIEEQPAAKGELQTSTLVQALLPCGEMTTDLTFTDVMTTSGIIQPYCCKCGPPRVKKWLIGNLK